MRTVWAIVHEIDGEYATCQMNEEGDMETLLKVHLAAFMESGSRQAEPGDLVALTVENDDITGATVSCGFARGMCEQMGDLTKEFFPDLPKLRQPGEYISYGKMPK